LICIRWTTPNGRKASIALEELGLPYIVHPIDIGKDEQFKPEFLKISPNNRIPAIVDRENGISLMESGAILIYLADKTGKLLPKSGEGHYRVLEWLMWQMGGPGPMFGQVHHFVKYNKGKAPYAEERYLKEAHRLYSVLDRRLAQHEFVADDYSIADIAIWPWVSRYEWQTVDLSAYANVKRGTRLSPGAQPCSGAIRCRRTSAKFLCRELESDPFLILPNGR
jgi:GSH-dependent disulfide-bond oxidoreductase